MENKEELWLTKFPGGMQGTRSVLNKTFMPDEFLDTIRPIFLIRHPALSFPSLERQISIWSGKSGAVERSIGMTYSFTRSLYDYYSDRYGKNPSSDGVKWPLVIDADDMINHQDLLVDIGELMRMKRSKMQFTWDKKTPKQLAEQPLEMKMMMMETLNVSTGVQTDKLSVGFNIDVEAKMWKAEFGEQAGKEVERLVRKAMGDYEWLKSRRTIPRSHQNSTKENLQYAGGWV
jgi:hypothetical protein